MAPWKSRQAESSKDPEREENPLEILRKKIFRFLNNRLGWPLAAVVMLGVAMWAEWDGISKMHGVSWVLEKAYEVWPLPKGRGDKFVIVLAKLERDPDGAHRALISDALQGQFSNDEVEIVVLDRSIPVDESDRPQQAVKEGHERARDLLRSMHANVMIWGEALDSKLDAPLRLHWTLVADVAPEKTSEKYRLSSAENFDLPELFRDDLNQVLSLLVSSGLKTFGPDDEDRRLGFMHSVKNLLASEVMNDSQKAILKLILADLLSLENDHEALESAAVYYHDVLEAYPRDRDWLDWAMTQDNPGEALRLLGERAGGQARIAEEVSAYQTQLKERAHQSAPLGWAITQFRLGDVLQKLSENDGYDEDAKERRKRHLRAAIVAYQEALKVTRREQLPVYWAALQYRVAYELHEEGILENAPQDMVQAVSAYREALRVYTSESAPDKRGWTELGLGRVLEDLAKHETGTDSSVQAVAAFQAALESASRGEWAPDWVSVQAELGDAMLNLAARETGPEPYAQAVSFYREALRLLSHGRSRDALVIDQRGLGKALMGLGLREGGTEDFRLALSACDEAITVSKRKSSGLDSEARKCRADALLYLGQRESGTDHLVQALAQYQECLSVAKNPLLGSAHSGDAQFDVAYALGVLGDRENGTKRLEEAAAAFRAAQQEYTDEGQPDKSKRAAAELALIKKKIAERGT